MFGPTYSGYVPPFHGPIRFTWAEVLTLFARPLDSIRLLHTVDNQDDLAIVTYVVRKSGRPDSNRCE